MHVRYVAGLLRAGFGWLRELAARRRGLVCTAVAHAQAQRRWRGEKLFTEAFRSWRHTALSAVRQRFERLCTGVATKRERACRRALFDAWLGALQRHRWHAAAVMDLSGEQGARVKQIQQIQTRVRPGRTVLPAADVPAAGRGGHHVGGLRIEQQYGSSVKPCAKSSLSAGYPDRFISPPSRRTAVPAPTASVAERQAAYRRTGFTAAEQEGRPLRTIMSVVSDGRAASALSDATTDSSRVPTPPPAPPRRCVVLRA
jgi:hypothetical protein